MSNIYQERGYDDRKDYLRSVAEDYDVPLHVVFELASLLGREEDFDGLVSMVQDYS